MARKIELKNIPLPNGAGTNGETEPAMFCYATMLKALLRYGPPAGLNFDEVIRSVDALAPIEKAIAENAASVTLTDEQWRTLRGKLDLFQFAFADPLIVEFGLMIRNAPELGT